MTATAQQLEYLEEQHPEYRGLSKTRGILSAMSLSLLEDSEGLRA